jgi:hypothetical protein
MIISIFLKVDWLNNYYQQIRSKLLNYLNGSVREYALLKTEPFKYSHAYTYCKTYVKSPAAKSINLNLTSQLLFTVVGLVYVFFKMRVTLFSNF